MKKFSWFVAMLLVTCMIFLVYGCKEQEFTPSGSSGDTESLTLDFNGAKLFGNSSVKFTSEEIEDVVGMPIETALVYLNFGIDRLERDNYEFVGWTLKKNGTNLVRYLPEYGVLYAKWDNGTIDDSGNPDDGTSGDPNAPLSVTLDFNGGTYEGESSLTLTAEELEMYVGMDITLAINNLRVFTTSFPSKSDGSTFVGFATSRNGNPGEPWTIPESGSHTLYAIYMQI
ncbi:MAG: hypothetical protein IJD23_00680 [Spirochaetaceae bacterium]|nr:hypothetical protein [Spirochaetaceae bacterium]